MTLDPGSTSPEAKNLQRPIARLLRPLVRLFVRSGITFPVICDLLRELYVNVAEYDFALSDKEQTDSRVSLLTGIHRKEVRRLRGAGAPVTVVPTALSRTSSILACWLASPRFTDEAGAPLVLPRRAEGSAPSFEALVASVTKDVRPRAILDEWLDRKLVTVDGNNCVTLLETALVPRSGDEQSLYYFGRNLHDHIAASVANITSAEPLFLERAVHYDGISENLARQFQDQSRALAMSALQSANRQAFTACESDPGGDWRWNFGVYVYAEQVPGGRQSPSPGHDVEEDQS
ncbi:hypothetical protein GCM10007874_41070 [Labrys miyagiensis]|uniref:Uncharacterized protein n=1 Tax=Labrys miyagiensis TaxID=346912 RepID=A0ABQ6CMP6_9HYPH|nr:DUF6502 family protein [Labrys miyagiensis]GLS21090.1 hypothetical protein GCM10007874_41070 [Labrys miyagiensis]